MQTHPFFSNARRCLTRGALILALCVLATLVTPLADAPAQAAPRATRYVSTTGTNSGDCSVNPCKTITYALTQAAAGDTISLAAGTYSTANGETLPLVPAVDVTISGAGASSTSIDGGGNKRVMTVNSGRTVTVQNVTITKGKSDYGGGIYNNGTLTVSNSTFSGNSATYRGGGIYAIGTLNYANTIIANSSGGDCHWGNIGTNTNNLVEDGSCSAALSGDPQLGTLANNGGVTQTFALLANSPAIDAGDATTCANSPISGLDQRGQSRNDLQCDIGAYEMQMSDRNNTTLNPGTTMRMFGPPRVGIQYTGTNPGSTTATKVTNWTGGTPTNALGAWWELTPTTGTGLNLTLKLCYSTAELGSLTESNLRFWRYSSGSWSQVGGAPTFSGTSPNRCAQISGVTALSRWTLATGNPGSAPTAVTLVVPRGCALVRSVAMADQVLGTVGFCHVAFCHFEKQPERNRSEAKMESKDATTRRDSLSQARRKRPGTA